MRNERAPRYQGKITSWKDEQGYGFIAPNGGGPAVFVHIKSIASRGVRPASNEVVTYDLTVNEKGQPRAENVKFVRLKPAHDAAPDTGATPLIAVAGFFSVVGALVVLRRLPFLILTLYLGLSAVAFVAYALDKYAAQNNRWRTRESTLHMLGLFGGWPGALVAQRILRHKSKKETFRTTFWATVVFNCCALVWLLSPPGARALRPFVDAF